MEVDETRAQWCFCFLETVFHYVALTGLELALETRLASNSGDLTAEIKRAYAIPHDPFGHLVSMASSCPWQMHFKL